MKADISIIIPSIGGEILVKTISLLNAGTIVPNEIIVVIPAEFSNMIPDLTIPNLHFEIVEFKGQVAQRAHGFKIAKCDFVLQLDDDVFLDVNCLEKLLNALRLFGRGHSVGPSIFYEDTNLSVYNVRNGFKGFVTNIITYVFSGSQWGLKRMGTISKNGSGFGIDFNRTLQEFNDVHWLAGGCILHYRSEIVLDNYFPFVGKAYGEDLIHSWLLTQAGIKLYNCKSAFCYIETPILNHENYSLKSDFKSRLYLNKLRNVSLFYTYIWFIFRLVVIKLSK